jgi:hypothetical protein
MGGVISAVGKFLEEGDVGEEGGGGPDNNDPEQQPQIPPTVYFNPLQKTQVVKDAYDSSLQQSRFQFQSPEHF